MADTYYYILTFSNTRDAIRGEAFAKEHISCAVMPLPPEIDKGCGLALRLLHVSAEEAAAFCKSVPLDCILYRMNTIRVNGVHSITKLYENKKA